MSSIPRYIRCRLYINHMSAKPDRTFITYDKRPRGVNFTSSKYHTWRHIGNNVTQITGKSTVSFTNCSCIQQRKSQNSTVIVWPFGNPPVTGRFPSKRASNVESVCMLWHHHGRAVHKAVRTSDTVIHNEAQIIHCVQICIICSAWSALQVTIVCNAWDDVIKWKHFRVAGL